MTKAIETLAGADRDAFRAAMIPYVEDGLEVTSRQSLNERNTRALLWFRDALGRMAGLPNVKNARIAIIGDSRSMGNAGGFSNTASVANSWPRYLTDMLNSAGHSATMEAWIGTHNVPAGNGIAGYDSRITATNWGYGDAVTGLSAGGKMFNCQVNGGVLAFAPTIPFDKVDAIYAGVGSGTFTVSVDGVSSANAGNALSMKTAAYDSSGLEIQSGSANPIMTCTGFSGLLRKQSIPGSFSAPVSSTIRVTTQSTNVNLVGIIASNSTKQVVQVLPMGWNGSETADWVSTSLSYGPLSIFPVMRPDLTIIDLGTNDLARFRTVAAFSANLQALITAAKAYGSVCLVVPFYTKPDMASPANPVLPYATTQDPFMAEVRRLAVVNGCALFDCNRRWGTYAAIGNLVDRAIASVPGWYVDGYHVYAPGQMDYARGLRDVLLRS